MPTVYDANGQTLGTLIDESAAGSSTYSLNIYNTTLGRIINLAAPSLYSLQDGEYIMGANVLSQNKDAIEYTTSDCTGSPYLEDIPNTPDSGIKTSLIKTGIGSYGIVQGGAKAVNLTVNSVVAWDDQNETLTPCQPQPSSSTDTAYPITNVSLPFSQPVAGPFKFSN